MLEKSDVAVGGEKMCREGRREAIMRTMRGLDHPTKARPSIGVLEVTTDALQVDLPELQSS